MYNSFGKHSHTAVICDNYVDHDGALGYHHTCYDNSHDVAQCPMSFANYGYQLNGQWAYVVYIHGDLQGKVTGYYLHAQSIDGSPYTLTPFRFPIQGVLQIVRTVTLHMVVISKYNLNIQTTESNNPELTFENYVKDLKTYENHGCSYKDHITDIIDALIDSSDDTIDNDCMNRSAMHTNTSCNNPEFDTDITVHSPSRGPHCPGNTNQRVDNRKCTDFNYPDKKVGFINLEATDFSFVGPDREVVKLDSIDKLIKTADTILSTGVLNYQEARIPIESGLNVQAWECYLCDYADKRLLQYIRFGFPLSLINSHELFNKEAINHFSAIQYPDHVLEYLNKEKALGALLGPVNHPIHDQYHCSPLLTKPKDINKMRVILNLSHPYGHSVNDHIDKDKFDSVAFALKFPSIDNITPDIVKHKGDVVLFKVDVARAFRNLRVDPADALKLGIRWADAFFVDLLVAFGWKHGSGLFKILSDAIAHIMAKKNKMRVILNLSHPYGHSVNDHVDKDKFDSVAFALKFPSIDNITQDIVKHKGDVVLFKLNVPRAFRNLRVDPTDALKLGIRWADAFFVDLSVTFGLKHGSGSFQILSNAMLTLWPRKELRCTAILMITLWSPQGPKPLTSLPCFVTFFRNWVCQ